ncbi:MAG: hypothetical protein PHP93_01535 [Kiritimatiellales bacterium]|nr:hypothetical protein [Kiritimatiellales bacterium]
MKQIVLLFFAAVCSASAEWIVLENCRLVENQSNDGDSFVVECSTPYRGETQNRFRLYFVDTAETDSNSDFKRERLKEQAAYWESDNPDVALKMGLRAEQTVKKWMRSSFSVYTQGEYAPSMGAPRYYALVQIGGRWLDELLAEEGLVRIYGDGTDLPDGTSADNHWRKLHELERAARSAGLNGWRTAPEKEERGTEAKIVERHDAALTRDAWIYSTKDGRKVMALLKGTPVSVLGSADGSRVRIRFKQNGTVYEGLCEKSSLD